MSKSAVLSMSGCLTKTFTRRLCSRARQLTNAEITQKRSSLFSEEKARQAALLSRVEKIQVEHHGPPEECTLLMNKGVSTPFNCAMHIQELLMTRSVLALVDGEPWDIHRPLDRDCQLRFLHFKDEDPTLVNEAFWRTCSFLLGYVLENAFKDDHRVTLCSFPPPQIKSGSFVYDAELNTGSWKPTTAELNCLSRIAGKLSSQDTPFERLDVDASVAASMFEDNRYKSDQIPLIAADSRSGSSVTVYRMGDHVDITRGPLIASTTQLGRYSVTAIHDIQSSDYGALMRIQGVATPAQLKIHYWAYEFLTERAAKLNPAPMPTLQKSTSRVAVEITNGS